MDNKISALFKEKFDKTVKKLTNRAIPIVKKEVVKAVKISSIENTNDAIKIVKTLAFGAVIFAAISCERKASGFGYMVKPDKISINIENLTINM